jgi:hypothetical protein
MRLVVVFVAAAVICCAFADDQVEVAMMDGADMAGRRGGDAAIRSIKGQIKSIAARAKRSFNRVKKAVKEHTEAVKKGRSKRSTGKASRRRSRKPAPRGSKLSLAPRSASGGQNSNCGKGHGKVRHYSMNSESSAKNGVNNPKTGKKEMRISTTKTKIFFKVTDVASGCIAQQLRHRFKDVVHKGGLFSAISRKFRTTAHWLRMVEVTKYAGHTKTTNKQGKVTKRQAIPKEACDDMVKKLSCKMGFLQSKDGHVLSVFHAKNSKAGCKKIKTQIAEAFESFYFQNGLTQYTVLGRDNGKPARQQVTVKAKNGELRRICRKTAPGTKTARIGAGKSKGTKSLKVGKGYSMCCNTYDSYGSMTKSSCYFKQRPGRGGLSKMTKTGKTPKWKKKLKRRTRRLPKSKRGANGAMAGNDEELIETGESPTAKYNIAQEDEPLVKLHLAETFDNSMDLDSHLALVQEKEMWRRSRRGKRSRRYRGRGNEHRGRVGGKGLEGQPAQKGTGGQYIKMERQEDLGEAMKEFSDTISAHHALADSWGEEVEHGQLGEDNHSHRGGWADIHPVRDEDFHIAAQLLQNQPRSQKTFNFLTDMYQRDGSAIDRVVNTMLEARSMSRDAKRMIVNALQGASEHEAAQSTLARLLHTKGFEHLAAHSSHGVTSPTPELMQALEASAFGQASPDKRCSSMLALGALADQEQGQDATRIAGRIAEAAMKGTSEGDHCAIRALGNVAEVAGAHREEVIKAIQSQSTPAPSRNELIRALKYMPGRRVDNFLASQFAASQDDDKKVLLATVLARRKNGASTEAAIDKVSQTVEELSAHAKLANTVKGIFKERLREFHSPASMRLLLCHHKKHAMDLMMEDTTSDDLGESASRKKAAKKASKKSSRKASKTASKKASKKASKTASKKASKKVSKKSSKKASKKTSKKSSKTASKKSSKKASKKASKGKGGYTKNSKKLKVTKMGGKATVKISSKINMKSCARNDKSVTGGKKGLIDCQRGMRTCVDNVKIKAKGLSGSMSNLGCIGASAFAFAYYKINKKKLKADAKIAGGFHFEFFKWGAKIFDTDNEVGIDGCKIAANIKLGATYFDVSKLKDVTLWSFKQGGDATKTFGFKGSNCKANQLPSFAKDFSKKMTFFTATYCYGLPKIAALCGSVSLLGQVGVSIGLGIVTPSKDAAVAKITPSASFMLEIKVEGTVIPFKGYVVGLVTLVNGFVPATVIAKFREDNTKCKSPGKIKFAQGHFVGWKIRLLPGSIVAGINGPGVKEEGVRELGEDTSGIFSSMKNKARAASQKAFQAAKATAKSNFDKMLKGAMPCASCVEYWKKTIVDCKGFEASGKLVEQDIKGKCVGKVKTPLV